jgi:hypothetical protein
MKLIKKGFDKADFELYKNGQPTGIIYTLNDDNNWSMDIELDNENEYDFIEVNIPRGYKPEYYTYRDGNDIIYKNISNNPISEKIIEIGLYANTDDNVLEFYNIISDYIIEIICYGNDNTKYTLITNLNNLNCTGEKLCFLEAYIKSYDDITINNVVLKDFTSIETMFSYKINKITFKDNSYIIISEFNVSEDTVSDIDNEWYNGYNHDVIVSYYTIKSNNIKSGYSLYSNELNEEYTIYKNIFKEDDEYYISIKDQNYSSDTDVIFINGDNKTLGCLNPIIYVTNKIIEIGNLANCYVVDKDFKFTRFTLTDQHKNYLLYYQSELCMLFKVIE